MDARQAIKLSRSQQNALHEYFQELADELNAQGITQRALLEMLEWIEVPNSKESIKALWVCIQEAQLGKKRTRNLYVHEVGQVYDTFNKAVGQECKIHIPFPSLTKRL